MEVFFMEFSVNHPILFILAGLIIAVARVMYKKGAL